MKEAINVRAGNLLLIDGTIYKVEETVSVYDNKPIDVIFPERIRLKVASAPPGIKQHDSTTAKQITLENGMVIDAPQFIEEGDIVEIDSQTGKYIDRIQE